MVSNGLLEDVEYTVNDFVFANLSLNVAHYFRRLTQQVGMTGCFRVSLLGGCGEDIIDSATDSVTVFLGYGLTLDGLHSALLLKAEHVVVRLLCQYAPALALKEFGQC